MDRKDEIIRLQNRILHEYAQHELKMIGNDLWGAPADPKVKKLHEKVAQITKDTPAPSAKQTEEVKPATESNEGSGAIIWLILALVVGLGVFAFLSAGRGGGMDKWKHSFSEMTGGLIGKKPKGRQ